MYYWPVSLWVISARFDHPSLCTISVIAETMSYCDGPKWIEYCLAISISKFLGLPNTSSSTLFIDVVRCGMCRDEDTDATLKSTFAGELPNIAMTLQQLKNPLVYLYISCCSSNSNMRQKIWYMHFNYTYLYCISMHTFWWASNKSFSCAYCVSKSILVPFRPKSLSLLWRLAAARIWRNPSWILSLIHISEPTRPY